MMQYQTYEHFQFGFAKTFTPMVKRLLIITVGAFLLQHILALLYHISLTKYFGLTPVHVVKNYMVWQLVTYMFLHGGWLHLFFNMFVLWMFGTEIERHWGSREFLFYYLLTGIGAGLVNVLFNVFTEYSNIPTIGASGAVYGILVAFGMMFPNRYIYLYFFFPVRAKYLVIVMALLTFFSAFSYGSDGIAHFAHLGGMAVGFLYLKSDWRLDTFMEWWREKKMRRRLHVITQRREENANFREELDKVLDRINEVGYDKLTREEKKVLQKASSYFSQEKNE